MPLTLQHKCPFELFILMQRRTLFRMPMTNPKRSVTEIWIQLSTERSCGDLPTWLRWLRAMRVT